MLKKKKNPLANNAIVRREYSSQLYEFWDPLWKDLCFLMNKEMCDLGQFYSSCK